MSNLGNGRLTTLPCPARKIFTDRRNKRKLNQLANKELKTFDDFRKARLDDIGFIVITDSTRHPIIHKLNGSCVSADNFKTKVMLGEKQTGSYYWADTVSSAALELRAAPCKVCKPHRPDKNPWKS